MKRREGRRGRGRKGGAPLAVSTGSTTNLQDDLQLLFNVAGSRFSLNTGELVVNKEQINKIHLRMEMDLTSSGGSASRELRVGWVSTLDPQDL